MSSPAATIPQNTYIGSPPYFNRVRHQTKSIIAAKNTMTDPTINASIMPHLTLLLVEKQTT